MQPRTWKWRLGVGHKSGADLLVRSPASRPAPRMRSNVRPGDQRAPADQEVRPTKRARGGCFRLRLSAHDADVATRAPTATPTIDENLCFAVLGLTWCRSLHAEHTPSYRPATREGANPLFAPESLYCAHFLGERLNSPASILSPRGLAAISAKTASARSSIC